MSEWELKIHTCNQDGTQPDSSMGDDWTILYKGEVFLWEGYWDLTLGEVRQLFQIIQKCEVPTQRKEVNWFVQQYRKIQMKYFPTEEDKRRNKLFEELFSELEASLDVPTKGD